MMTEPSLFSARYQDRLAEICNGSVARRLLGSAARRLDMLVPGRLMIRERSGSLRWLRPTPAQRHYATTCGSRNIILKARQVGMTTYIAARYFLATIAQPGTVTLQVAHSLESAQHIFRIVHRFVEHLGPATRRQLLIRKSNVRELAFAATDSRYIVDTAGNRHAGRGLTIHNLHASEVALWPGDAGETMAALLAAVPPDGNVDIESTPNGVGGYFHAEWSRAQSGSGMTPHFFPWWWEPAYREHLSPGEALQPFTEDERQLIEKHGLVAEQIKFRRKLRHQFGDLAPQEYAESDAQCFLVSGRPYFDIAALERQALATTAPLRTLHNGASHVWLEPEAGRDYIIGADVAEGKEAGDDSAAIVVDAASGLLCAEWLVRWPVRRFAEELDALGRRYRCALIAVERNNHGHAVLEALENSLHYPRLYRHRGDSTLGWPTNAQTKPYATNLLATLLRDAPHCFASPRLIAQCRSYSYLDSGGTGAQPGTHDDLVIALAIAHAVRQSVQPVQLHAWAR